MSQHPRRPAFTLVELMVVVTIIVILIAILVPSLDKAMGAANKATCLANLKAFSTAYHLYAADYQGEAMYIAANRPNYWHHRVAPYMGFTTYGKEATDGAPKFMMCAETVVTYNDNAAAPTAHGTWMWITAQSSYSMNMWITNYPEGLQYFPQQELYHVKFDRAPGQTPVVGDSVWLGAWPLDTDIDPGNYETWGSYDEGGMARMCINRHGNFTTNSGFVDGSARNMVLGELWAVPWHRKFNPSYKSGGWD